MRNMTYHTMFAFSNSFVENLIQKSNTGNIWYFHISFPLCHYMIKCRREKADQRHLPLIK